MKMILWKNQAGLETDRLQTARHGSSLDPDGKSFSDDNSFSGDRILLRF
jgi:hypothetical protein